MHKATLLFQKKNHPTPPPIFLQFQTPEILLRQPFFNEILNELNYAIQAEPVARFSTYLFGLFEKDSMHQGEAIQKIIPMKTSGQSEFPISFEK